MSEQSSNRRRKAHYRTGFDDAVKAAASLAEGDAEQRWKDGDPEGAGVIRDLAEAIRKLRADIAYFKKSKEAEI